MLLIAVAHIISIVIIWQEGILIFPEYQKIMLVVVEGYVL